MKIALITKNTTKLCHACPGDTFRIPDDPSLYILCRHNTGAQVRKRFASSGLYTEENPIFKVNLETGEASPLPHLSSRVEIISDVAVTNYNCD